jgi:hypothetical protein
MLVFPEYEQAWARFLFKALDELGRGRDPLLSQFSIDSTTHAGAVQHVDGEFMGSQLPPMRVEGHMSIKRQDVELTNVPAIVQSIEEGARSLLDSLAEQFFPRMNTVLEEAGQVTDAQGQPLTPDLFLDGLEKVELEFDASGQPKMPVLAAHPDVIDAFLRCPFTEEHKRRFTEIIERKRKAFNAKKRSRRLS